MEPVSLWFCHLSQSYFAGNVQCKGATDLLVEGVSYTKTAIIAKIDDVALHPVSFITERA